jgi:hypothetical protein
MTRITASSGKHRKAGQVLCYAALDCGSAAASKGGRALQCSKKDYRGILTGLQGVTGKKVVDAAAMSVKDTSEWSREPERQFVSHPARSLLPPWQAVAILIGWSILAYYSHLALVTLLFAVGLIEILSCVLLEDHTDGFESVYGKVEGIRSEIRELRESAQGLEDKLEGVSGELGELETPSLDDYTPSISRLENEIAWLRREIETLRCKRST